MHLFWSLLYETKFVMNLFKVCHEFIALVNCTARHLVDKTVTLKGKHGVIQIVRI